jgi:hypothetical protein
MRAFRTTILVLAITAGIYTIADYLVGLWRPETLNVSLDGGEVPAYRNQPYVNADFIREKALEPGSGARFPANIVTPPEYHGPFQHR